MPALVLDYLASGIDAHRRRSGAPRTRTFPPRCDHARHLWRGL